MWRKLASFVFYSHSVLTLSISDILCLSLGDWDYNSETNYDLPQLPWTWAHRSPDFQCRAGRRWQGLSVLCALSPESMHSCTHSCICFPSSPVRDTSRLFCQREVAVSKSDFSIISKGGCSATHTQEAPSQAVGTGHTLGSSQFTSSEGKGDFPEANGSLARLIGLHKLAQT